jgi:hypothetical protein
VSNVTKCRACNRWQQYKRVTPGVHICAGCRKDPFADLPARAAPSALPALDLFDRRAATAAREAGIAQVEANACPEWKDRAYAMLLRLASEQEEVHADDLRRAMGDDQPRTPSATGPVFLRAARAGVLRKTVEYRYSEATTNHSAHPIWRSLVNRRSA